jgi:hypothetical protein
MPRLNGTGPQGLGSRTGHGIGWCLSGYGLGPWGGGLGRDWGRGFRFRCFWWPFSGLNIPFHEPTPKEEKEMLSEELKYLREEIKEIEKRLEELKKG